MGAVVNNLEAKIKASYIFSKKTTLNFNTALIINRQNNKLIFNVVFIYIISFFDLSCLKNQFIINTTVTF